MTRRLLLSYLTVTAFVLAVLIIPLGSNFARTERARLLSEIERDATVMSSFVEDRLEVNRVVALDAIVEAYAARTGARAVLADATGRALADSDPDQQPGEDFSKRPEFARALAGDVAAGSRYSMTLRTDLLYVAVPVASGGRVLGVVRITYAGDALRARILRNWMWLGIIGSAILCAVALVGWALARSLARPVAHLERATTALAEGHLDERAVEEGPHELRALARAFNDMAQRLQALITSQHQFVADASHELRTPLTALRLRLENLEGSVDAGVQEDLDGALRESRRLQRIVEGLLSLARLDVRAVERTIADVGEILADRAAIWGPLAEQKDVRIDLGDGADAGGALALPGSLEQIVDNFIANALEVSPPGSSIGLRAERDREWVAIHVVDHGPGLSHEDRLRAFDRFWRKDDGRAPGSGLGLAIARRLARASGGDATLEPGANGGVDAVVRLRAAG